MRLFALFLAAPLLAACASGAPPAPAPAPVAPPPTPRAVATAPVASARPAAPPPACFPAARSDAEIFSATLAGDRLTVCLSNDEDPAHPCLVLDLTSKQVERTAAARGDRPAAEAPSNRSEDARTGGNDRAFLVCSRPGRSPQKRCDSIRPTGRVVAAGQGEGDDRGLFAAYSPDFNTIAAIVPERTAGGELIVSIDTYSTRSLGPLTRRRVPSTAARPGVFSDPSDVWSLRWLDSEHLRLRARRCCGPDGREALLDLRRGTFEELGDPTLLRPIRDGVWLRGNSVRGADEASSFLELTFMHLDSGQRSRLRLPGHPSKEPEGRDLLALPWTGTSWVVVETNPPGVVWLDVEHESIVAHRSFDLCPAPVGP